MSKPLEKLKIKTEVGSLLDHAPDNFELMQALNAAIDRINELEAKYESHIHYVGAGFDYAKPTSRAKYPSDAAPGDCPECNGTGLIGADPKAQCSNCGGTGKVA
jgi:hypothetical protein